MFMFERDKIVWFVVAVVILAFFMPWFTGWALVTVAKMFVDTTPKFSFWGLWLLGIAWYIITAPFVIGRAGGGHNG